ncbi:PilZ domain-containing protein [Aneurinibacillus sp. UBA3580]|jgi:c-di-GMP-binding flagellar brake protein YcgR|uniref:PilZ domain-containing protein n=1 Tax=Aneurinibacillus sp. UBA3580 TaxID=1946041 RepID=UPI0025810A84|nr:PilZ domain-containing protein [Aneurinibacillus sp. UBA3580]
MEIVQFEYRGKLELGRMEMAEGELLYLEVKNPEAFTVGDFLVFFYGGRKFSVKIVKKSEKYICLFVPLFETNFPNNRRRWPRVKVELSAFINDYLSEKVYEIPADLRIRIIDVSIQGFGFVSHDPLKVNHSYYILFDVPDLAIKTKTILRHEKLADDGYRYGCEILSITKQDFTALRRYVLLQQLVKGGRYSLSE